MESRTESDHGDFSLAELIVDGIEEYAIFTIDLEGRIRSWNPGVEQLLCYGAEEFVGRDAAIILTPEDAEPGALDRDREEARSGGRARSRRWYLRRDGSRFWGEALFFALGEGENPHCFAMILRDDTERKLLEDQVAEANYLKEVFLATLAHELRTPLMAILGWTQVLRDGDIDKEMLEMGIGIIEQSALTQSRLVEDILDLARIASAKIGLHRVPVDLRELVDSAVESMRPVMREKGLRLDVALLETPTIISGDPERLRQIIGNLLANALKFTPAGGTVSVGLKRSSQHARIIVSDTGKGIDAESLGVIFEPFIQAEEPGKSAGTGLGLGLSVARQLVELHDGTIDAASDGSGRGATFTISLPLIGVASAGELQV